MTTYRNLWGEATRRPRAAHKLFPSVQGLPISTVRTCQHLFGLSVDISKFACRTTKGSSKTSPQCLRSWGIIDYNEVHHANVQRPWKLVNWCVRQFGSNWNHAQFVNLSCNSNPSIPSKHQPNHIFRWAFPRITYTVGEKLLFSRFIILLQKLYSSSAKSNSNSQIGFLTGIPWYRLISCSL